MLVLHTRQAAQTVLTSHKNDIEMTAGVSCQTKTKVRGCHAKDMFIQLQCVYTLTFTYISTFLGDKGNH